MEFTQAELSRAYMASKALQAYKNLFDTLPKPNTGSVSAGAIPKAKSWLKPADAVRFFKANKQGKQNIAYELKTTVQLLNAEVDKIMESDYTMFEGDRISRIVNLGPHFRIAGKEISGRQLILILEPTEHLERILFVIRGGSVVQSTSSPKGGQFAQIEDKENHIRSLLWLVERLETSTACAY